MCIPGALIVLAGVVGLAARGAGDAPADRVADVHRAEMRIVSPAPGAVVWGRFAIGVEVSGTAALVEAGGVRLELSDGTILGPVSSSDVGGPTTRLVFSVDASGIAAGPLEIRARARDDGALRSAAPIRLRVVHPEPSSVLAGECEAFITAPRPEAFGPEPPRVGARADASGGRFVACTSPDPVWILPFDAPETGRYQVAIVARGDAARGALPSVGIYVDSLEKNRTAARLVDSDWHRIPVGLPIDLEAGERHLALRFMNDFHLPNTADRNLYLDRFEILRVEDAGASAPGASMGMAMAMAGMSAEGERAEGIRIGFTRALDGLPVTGSLRLDGICRWAGMEDTPAPRIELLLNGAVVGSQQATRPVFPLDRSALSPGPNRVRMVATLPDGRRGSTPEQTLFVNGAPRPALAAREFRRFSVVDERWDDALREMHSSIGEEPGHLVARMLAPGVARLALPAELEGTFELLLEARGPNAPLAGLLDVTLERAGMAPVTIGQATVSNWWSLHRVATLELEPGAKTLALRVGQGSHEPRADNEELLLRSLMLRVHRERVDRGPPRAEILYPPAGHVAHGVDVVVVDAADDEDRLGSGDLLIDGVRQRSYVDLPDGAGYLVFPVLLRDVAPGEHVLSVRVEDRSGNLVESLEVPFVVTTEAPAELGAYARAVRLLNRFAHGPEPQQLAELLVAGEEEWLATRLSGRGAGDLSAHALALAEMRDLNEYAVTRAAITHAIGTRNPVWERFTWWLENHFSTWIRKSSGALEWSEHETFLRLGPTRFAELLTASATSPAMLVYLDQRESYAGRLNENYAREIMELHTLGVTGGYTQADVTELAGLLAGLTLAQEALPSGVGGVLAREFRFAPELGDGREREILSTHFAAAGPDQRWERFERALALLARHPSTARFVSEKLARHYVSTSPPEDLLEHLVEVFRATDGDLQELLLAIARHGCLFDPELEPRVMSPLDFGIALGRRSENPAAHWALRNYLDRSGMAYFGRPTPDGYPEDDAAWTDSNVTLQRWSLPRDIRWALHGLVPDDLRSGAAGDVAAWRQRVIDVVAVRITGFTLGETSNQAALDFFDQLEGHPWGQVNSVAVLVSQLPEAGLK